jgi:hypothetical protein
MALARADDMSHRPLLCYDYVNSPYTIVRDALLVDPISVFRRATAVAQQAARLHFQVGSLDLGVDVSIDLIDVVSTEKSTSLKFRWSAATSPGLFPAMDATLAVYPLTPTETQLELQGSYTPPLGPLGTVIDAAVGHRIAEAAVTRFTAEVAGWLRRELGPQVEDGAAGSLAAPIASR